MKRPAYRRRVDWGAYEAEYGSMHRYRDIRLEYFRITLHYAGAYPSAPRESASVVREIQMDHMEDGFHDLGYHYLVDPWGIVFGGRSIYYVGAHCPDRNYGNLGIAYLGDPSGGIPSGAIRSFQQMLLYWCWYLWIDPKQIGMHDLTCPPAPTASQMKELVLPGVITIGRRDRFADSSPGTKRRRKGSSGVVPATPFPIRREEQGAGLHLR